MAGLKNSIRIFGISLFQGILPISKNQIPLDIIAGITLAALAIPEVMGYAKIAGMPVVTGLYTLLLPMACYAIFCSSRHLVVGADSATAALIATSLVLLAVPGSPQYVAMAGMASLLAGVFLFLARIFNLAFIADFLSRTVLIGFLTGVGLQVALGQLPGVFGVPKIGEHLIQQVLLIATEMNQMQLLTVFMSGMVIGIILLGDRFIKKVPWALLVVIGSIAASYALNLASLGISLIGPVPGGLPAIGVPDIPLDQIPSLFGLAAACFVVILAQSAATSRAYASRYQEKFDEGTDLIGLGFANIAAGFSGTFLVNGSPTKTEMVDSAGGKTQIAQLVTVGIVLLVLLFLTAPLSFLPEAVLASIVFTIGIRLIDISGMKSIHARRPVEFGVALATTLSVIIFGVGWGIVFAILISLIAHLRHSYHPINFLLYRDMNGVWSSEPLSSGRQAIEGLAIYRFGANIYYANEGRMAEEILDIVDASKTPIKWFCFSFSSVNDIDFSGSESLLQIYDILESKGISLVFSNVEENVKAELTRDGIIDFMGSEHIFSSKDEVVTAYEAWRTENR